MKKNIMIFLFLLSFLNLFASNISEKILIETVEMLKKERNGFDVLYVLQDSRVNVLDKHKIPKLLEQLRNEKIKKDNYPWEFYYENKKYNDFTMFGGFSLSSCAEARVIALFPEIKFSLLSRGFEIEQCSYCRGKNIKNKFRKVGSISLIDAFFIDSKRIFVYITFSEEKNAIVVETVDKIKVVNFGETESYDLFLLFEIDNGKVSLKEKYFINLDDFF